MYFSCVSSSDQGQGCSITRSSSGAAPDVRGATVSEGEHVGPLPVERHARVDYVEHLRLPEEPVRLGADVVQIDVELGRGVVDHAAVDAHVGLDDAVFRVLPLIRGQESWRHPPPGKDIKFADHDLALHITQMDPHSFWPAGHAEAGALPPAGTELLVAPVAPAPIAAVAPAPAAEGCSPWEQLEATISARQGTNDSSTRFISVSSVGKAKNAGL
jgi:hypothetical protein